MISMYVNISTCFISWILWLFILTVVVLFTLLHHIRTIFFVYICFHVKFFVKYFYPWLSITFSVRFHSLRLSTYRQKNLAFNFLHIYIYSQNSFISHNIYNFLGTYIEYNRKKCTPLFNYFYYFWLLNSFSYTFIKAMAPYPFCANYLESFYL